jgi:hypothetical protein
MYRTAFGRVACAAAVLASVSLWALNRRSARAQENTSSVRLGRQEVSVDIDDRHSLAVTTVRQEWTNAGKDARSASFLLPISDEAALLHYQVTAPESLPGKKGAPHGKLEAAGRNLYRASVDAVPAHGRVRCELVYAEALTRRGQRRKFIYPIPSPEGGNSPASLAVEVRIRADAAPERVRCATHPMALSRPSARMATLTCTTHEPPDGRDLVVDYELPPSREDARAHLSVFSPPDTNRDPYFLLTLPPPAALLQDNRALDQPADIIFCLDISGSTRGRKLDAIQEAVRDGLADLSPHDRFGVIAFDDEARAYRRELVAATPAAISQATRWVSRLRPGAGSDPERALKTAAQLLEQRAAASRRAFVAMVVDREDTANLTAGAAALRLRDRNVRLTVLGALSDSRLMNVRVAGSKLQNGPAIALSRAAITFGPGLAGAAFDPELLNASYIYPAPEKLPTLPLSTPVLLFGRLNEAPPARGTVSLAGKVEGKARTLKTEFVTQTLRAGSPVPALWANRRIRRLYQLAARGEDSHELLGAVGSVRDEGGLAGTPEP